VEILALRGRYGFRVHADAAYGGYFTLAQNLDEHAKAAFARIAEVDSIVIDPHKHGLQPYGCGCVMFRDPSVGRLYKHDSPYTYFSSAELHLGEISLECSRPGAAAAALWATQKLLPLEQGGEFARGLERGREAALALHQYLLDSDGFVPAFPPELDIVVFAPKASSVTELSALSRKVFTEAAERGLHLALAELPVEFLRLWTPTYKETEHGLRPSVGADEAGALRLDRPDLGNCFRRRRRNPRQAPRSPSELGFKSVSQVIASAKRLGTPT